MGGQYQRQSGVLRHVLSTGYVSHTISLGQQWTLTYRGHIWRPPTDVYETDDTVVVKLEVAGMAEDDFNIIYDNGVLAISGMRRDSAAKVGYHQMEIPYGEFHTEVLVPVPINVDSIEATYQNGFLFVTLPKNL